MRKAIFITVRLASTRLPQKALLKLYGETSLIEHDIRRAKLVQGIDAIVLCTTEDANDDLLCEIATKEGIYFYRGSTEDKLSRWLGAADKFKIDYFITYDADDPLCDPELIEKGFKQYEVNHPDLLEAPDVSAGAFTYGLDVKALREICKNKKSESTEMMWVYFTENEAYSVESLLNVDPLFLRPQYRLTLDYPEDLRFFQELFGETGYSYETPLRKVLAYLDLHPEIANINFFRHQEFLDNQQNKIRVNSEREK